MRRQAKLIRSGKTPRRGFGRAILVGIGVGTVALATLVIAIMVLGRSTPRPTLPFSETPNRGPSAIEPTTKSIPPAPLRAVRIAEQFAQAATTTQRGHPYGSWIQQVKSIVTASYLRALNAPLGNAISALSTTTARVQWTVIARPPIEAQAAIDVVLSTRTTSTNTKALAGNAALLVDLVNVGGRWLVSGFQQ